MPIIQFITSASTIPRAPLTRWGRLALGSLWCGSMALLAACGPSTQQAPPPMLVADPPPSDAGVPGAGVADFDRGLAMIESEAWAEAISHFDKAIAAQPKNAEAVYFRALAQDQLGQRQGAIEGYRKALELDEKLINARLNLGAIYLEEPVQAEKAVEVLTPAIAMAPKATEIRENLAFAYETLGRIDEAATQYDAALAMKPEARVYLNYADMLYRAKRQTAAAEQYKQALGGFSKDLKLTVYIAHQFTKTKAYDDCVIAFTNAIALEANEPSLHVYRGLCRHRLQQEEKARKNYLSAIKINDKFQPAYYYLGVSYAKAKIRGKAQWALAKAIELNPTSVLGKKAAKQLKKL